MFSFSKLRRTRAIVSGSLLIVITLPQERILHRHPFLHPLPPHLQGLRNAYRGKRGCNQITHTSHMAHATRKQTTTNASNINVVCLLLILKSMNKGFFLLFQISGSRIAIYTKRLFIGLESRYTLLLKGLELL